jgi:hypothetical protein
MVLDDLFTDFALKIPKPKEEIQNAKALFKPFVFVWNL